MSLRGDGTESGPRRLSSRRQMLRRVALGTAVVTLHPRPASADMMTSLNIDYTTAGYRYGKHASLSTFEAWNVDEETRTTYEGKDYFTNRARLEAEAERLDIDMDDDMEELSWREKRRLFRNLDWHTFRND